MAIKPPSSVVTVTVAEPSEIAATTPPDDTVATEVLLLLHVTFWFVALEGVIVGARVTVPPTSMLAEVLSRKTPVTLTMLALTVTVQESV